MTSPFASRHYLTDGGIETDLIFHDGFDLPHFSAVMLMRSAEGRAGLAAYYRRYLDVAAERNTAFLLESPTWRASSDWAGPLGISEAELVRLNRAAIGLMRELRADHADRIPSILISGCIGPRGDGYNPGTIMEAGEAADYHHFQTQIFAEEGVDLVSAITMTNVPEAVGLVEAANRAGVPSVISFTLETDGRLPTEMPLADAIAAVDAASDPAPVHYMINCAHPSHFADTLAAGSTWLERLGGLRTNASRMSHAELNEAVQLDEGDPHELGELHTGLARQLSNLRVVGGCCGTDARHVAQMAHGWARA